MSDKKQPLSTLRGRLRNVVGNLEILNREMEGILEAADAGGALDEWGNGCPNEQDHMVKMVMGHMDRIEALRKEIRQFMSKPRKNRRSREQRVVHRYADAHRAQRRSMMA